MIAYDLACSNGHIFEGWFDDAKAYERQKRQGLLTCPVCADKAVARRPSTFAIKGSAPSSPPGINVEELGRRLYDFVQRNFDDVGTDFAREALKIHYGAAEPRNIRGVSTRQEEDSLRSEGVEFLKLPIPVPRDDPPKN
jgi:hypothetical protein